MDTTCPDCGSNNLYIDGSSNLCCFSCGEIIRPATEEDLAAWEAYLEDEEELARDRILEQQELSDFAQDDLDYGGECYDFEGCCDE